MKHKVSELEGALLDFAVARIERGDVESNRDFAFWRRELWETGEQCYSTNWADGGPLIERERITIVASGGYEADEPLEWSAEIGAFTHYIDEMLPLGGGTGKTPLIAAMRAFVASKLGDEVELPAGEMNG